MKKMIAMLMVSLFVTAAAHAQDAKKLGPMDASKMSCDEIKKEIDAAQKKLASAGAAAEEKGAEDKKAGAQ